MLWHHSGYLQLVWQADEFPLQPKAPRDPEVLVLTVVEAEEGMTVVSAKLTGILEQKVQGKVVKRQGQLAV